MPITPPPTGGVNVPSALVPGSTQGVMLQAARAIYDPTTGLWYGPLVHTIADPITGQQVTVAQFHNADNQALPTTSYGLLAGGVTQLLNPLGNLDRQRSTGFDGIPASGVSTGAAQFLQQLQTTATGAITISTASATITPALMTGIQVGAPVILDFGTANAENAFVTALPSGTTATVVPTNLSGLSPSFRFGHSGTYVLVVNTYNQERDASGELDGATGKGTAVAAEYEYNGGGPGGANYDRERNLNGKVQQVTTITTGGTVGINTATLTVATGLQPGQPVLLTGGTSELVYTAMNYTAGSTAVTFATNIVNASHTGAQWDIFAATGVGSGNMTPFGLGIEMAGLYDATAGSYQLLQGRLGVEYSTVGGSATTAIASGTAGNTVVKASPGRLCRVLVTTTNTNPMQIFDNASTNTGTIIGALPASPAVGTVYDFQLPAAAGITVAGNAANPAVTISYY